MSASKISNAVAGHIRAESCSSLPPKVWGALPAFPHAQHTSALFSGLFPRLRFFSYGTVKADAAHSCDHAVSVRVYRPLNNH